MAQSLVQNYEHIIYSTKNREPLLSDPAIRQEVHAYLGGVCRNLKSPALIVGGVEDHVHILCRLSKSISMETFIRELKRESSRWIKARTPDLRNFCWQRGYGGFSVSPSHIPLLRRYIATQEEHHRNETFQDELRRLLGKYGVAWDERYLWD